MGYAKLDTHREIRSGFAEVIFCARKADEHLLKIFTRLYEQDGEVFGTRASEHQYELIREKFPEVVYDPLSHILKIEKRQEADRQNRRLHGWNRGYFRCRGGGADRRILWCKRCAYLRCRCERYPPPAVASRYDSERQLRCSRCRYGRSAGERARRLGGQAGDCCSDIRWLRGQHEWSFGAAYDD